jgi:hypothetical protein
MRCWRKEVFLANPLVSLCEKNFMESPLISQITAEKKLFGESSAQIRVDLREKRSFL